MSDNQKNILIVVLIVCLSIVSYIAFSPQKPYDDSIIKERMDKLSHENDSLLNDNKLLRAERSSYYKKINSLNSLEPKIEIRYVEKYKQIDNASINSITNEFDSLFSKNGI